MSRDIPTSAHDHTVHRVFSVDDDPNEVENDVRYLEGLHDGLKYALHGNKASPNPTKSFSPSTNHIDSNFISGSDISLPGNTSRPKINIESQNDNTIPSNTSTDQERFIIHHPATDSGHDLLIEELGPHGISGDVRDIDVDNDEEYEEDNEFSDRHSRASSMESLTLKERQDAINKTHPFGIRIWKPALYKKQRSVQKAADEDIHETKFKTITLGVHLTNIIWSMTCGLMLCIICYLAAFLVMIIGLGTKSTRDYAGVFCKLGIYLLWPFGKVVYLNPDEHYLQEDKDEGISVQQFYGWVTSYSNKLFFHKNQSMESNHLNPPQNNTNGNDQNIQPVNSLSYPSYGSIQTYINSQNQVSGSNIDQNTSSVHHNPLGESSPATEGPNMGDSTNFSSNPNQRRYFGRGEWTLGRILFYALFHLIFEPITLILCLLTWLCVFTIPMSSILWNLLYHCRKHPLALGFKYIKTSSDQTRPMIMKSNNHLPTVRTLRNELNNHLATGTSSARYINQQQYQGNEDDYDNRNILLCTFRCAGWHYYKYTVDGTNIIVVNLISLVFFTIFDFYFMKESWNLNFWFTNESSIFILCLASIIPLAFYIGQAVASISAQTSMGVGAVINAFFSTIVEIFLYCVALKGHKGQLVEGSMIGSILGAVLLLPGLSMCGGALNRKTQRYNPASAGVSSALLIFSMIVMFVPTMLYEIYGSYTVICRDKDSNVLSEDSISMKTITMAVTLSQCYFTRPPLKYNKMFRNVIQPMSVSCAIILFLAYAIGLWFTLRTHAKMIWQLPISDPPKEQHLEEALPLTSTQSNIKTKAAVGNDDQGSHEAPNWSRSKSTWILLIATLLYAVIAEILVSCVDAVLKDFPGLDPKFLGLTIFALVPNTTEFLNAISFAMHGNVALSMEIGSAYALQVCLLQIPALVLYSIMYTWNIDQAAINIREQMFPLVFPKWDLIGSMASVFMFTYLYAEGKSNYFKGSMLILLYIIIVFGFWFQGVIEEFRTYE
ncbi:similar to Saccharomyces cerevisiae YNL321W VNX1 Calcium/H+ antiporter localized to the endoplasmic reticulum membrane [Maudiozyma barnettii]|uniref:Similar to Saccharomyces cerevisiae YNL321W VNX1 Calcium/H+ antiporter localized to the endoplasmic reticulum membrane n=1 Tax=Maudiozyma barnettii TaxID=61262 RepID=A0A8H2VDN4_9SACH|nr:Vnx1p [Kazachstania barnettii]CAB4253510.1 similar to Saccharomyces cerevisiae YNL321W VNX1 Calcium/H+ antiporter localized to the endoplasmic reticulum membrane [Kazachstania barnettii]CAD1781184.1 similar to Saccharomyces cerevisiae YNL321W VNX1 Calcium/H+ antiporter localized to the endoplasmic reticulum membrane [Kazachstania barnettii]